MRSDARQLGIAPSSSIDNLRPSQFVSLALVLTLAVLSVACGTLSQAGSGSNQATGKIAIAIQPHEAKVGVAYSTVPSVSGGTDPYAFSLQSGILPPGVGLDQRTGSISGIPTVAGDYTFTLLVSDSTNKSQGTTIVRILVTAASDNNQHAVITVSPSSTTIVSEAVVQFTAIVAGTSETGVAWSATAGIISKTGSFAAPKVSSNTSVTVTATSTSSSTVHGSATITVTPAPVLAITTSTLTEANVGTLYSASLSATGGKTPYQWSLASGSLPSGITLQASTGALNGTTLLSGSFAFSAKVTDSAGTSSTHALTLSVSSNSTTGFDGPAELPRVYIRTAMANTLAPGTTIPVKSGDDLQSALNSANCGDTVMLQAGATFTGIFTFPAKNCDDNHWIVVRTNAVDSALPPEGTRLTPCSAGVTSLPGRPALNCSSSTNVLAKLVMAVSANGPVVFATGANHYRLMGLEITRATGIGIVYSLASVVSGGTANNIIFDRVWLHGTVHDETKKGFELGGASYASAVDSYFTDIHCIAVTGACTDAAAIGGGSNNPVGPFKIVNNFLESSGENILLGGGSSTVTPADIQISQNHFFKPLTWMLGQPGFVGGSDGNPFIVKNLFELKNAQRVLFEGNILEYSWGGFSQGGYAMLLTPTNQASSSGVPLCPLCQVTDVTIRYNTISHVGAGLQIANDLSSGAAALDGQRYSIHDITIDDMDAVKYAGSGKVAEILRISTLTPPLQNVSINHITAFASVGLFSIGGALSPLMANFSFNNSIYIVGPYPVWSTGGTTNCANYDKPLTTFNACFAPYSFVKNALIASSSQYPPSLWPSGNFFPASVNDVQFVNYNNGNGGNYQLLNTSPYRNAGTDGKDLGADIATIVSETTGVY